MRRDEIEELIKLVEESGISELEVCDGRKKIRISKGATAAAVPAAQPLPNNPSPPIDATVEDAAGDAGRHDPGDFEKLASNLKQITSPMVGTFYRSPAPGTEPFVSEGQVVNVGQTVCIVEAMKLMNEIGSDFSGVVRKVLIENAQPVEYGQPLFLVELK
jgi:acetyl-CoA carboxylase biotin carboxyl carrier protein